MNCEYEIADGVLIISEGVTVIEIGAFEERTDFTSVVFPDSLKEIGARAFAATALETVTIPGGIIDLEECVFAECESLKSVVLEEGLISVGEAHSRIAVSLKWLFFQPRCDSFGRQHLRGVQN